MHSASMSTIYSEEVTGRLKPKRDQLFNVNITNGQWCNLNKAEHTGMPINILRY